MGIREVVKKKKKLHRQRRRHGTQAEAHAGGGKNVVWDVLTLPPLQQLKPVKTGRRRRQGREEERGEDDEEVEEAVTTPKGEGCRIPAEAETCPPAPKKPRTAVLVRDGCGCDCDGDGEALDEFFRVPLDLEAVFASRAAKAN